VPLRFTKFDLRDYLWNLYNVEVTAVRSFVRRQVAPIKNDAGRYVRPPAEKYMTVEMTKPFVWPEVPKDLSPWDAALYKQREKMLADQDRLRKERYKGNIPLASDGPLTQEEKKYRALARELLEGKKKWENGVALDVKWDSVAPKAKESATSETPGKEEEKQEEATKTKE
jgi:large subunit ribosomal protein L23